MKVLVVDFSFVSLAFSLSGCLRFIIKEEEVEFPFLLLIPSFLIHVRRYNGGGTGLIREFFFTVRMGFQVSDHGLGSIKKQANFTLDSSISKQFGNACGIS